MKVNPKFFFLSTWISQHPVQEDTSHFNQWGIYYNKLGAYKTYEKSEGLDFSLSYKEYFSQYTELALAHLWWYTEIKKSPLSLMPSKQLHLDT